MNCSFCHSMASHFTVSGNVYGVILFAWCDTCINSNEFYRQFEVTREQWDRVKLVAGVMQG